MNNITLECGDDPINCEMLLTPVGQDVVVIVRNHEFENVLTLSLDKAFELRDWLNGYLGD